MLALDSTLGELDEQALERELASLVSNLDTELEATLDLLEGSRGDLFSALSTILDADFSVRLNHSRWLRQSYGGQLSESQHARLDSLERHIEQLDVARQYFKTIYIKQELADVSKLVMYTGLVAILVAISVLVLLGYASTPPGPGTLLGLVPSAVAINLLPLALLVSHVVRITTVARRTAAITPFISPTE